jgi:hypothetical protein
MGIRIECTVERNKGDWVEYKPLRLRDRLRFQNAVGEEAVWEAIRDCLMSWEIHDADGSEVPQLSGELTLDDLGDLSEPVYAWIVGSFTLAVVRGRQEAQSPSS